MTTTTADMAETTTTAAETAYFGDAEHVGEKVTITAVVDTDLTALGRFVLNIVGSFLSGARRCGGRRVNSRPFPVPGRAAADPGRRWRHRCRGR